MQRWMFGPQLHSWTSPPALPAMTTCSTQVSSRRPAQPPDCTAAAVPSSSQRKGVLHVPTLQISVTPLKLQLPFTVHRC